MRPLFRFVAETGIREVFVGLALLIVVGITLLMQFVGLSAALGTFLAGVVLAESEYRHELEMDLDPFKGLLLAVFFIAVGAGIDFSLLLDQPLLVLGLVARLRRGEARCALAAGPRSSDMNGARLVALLLRAGAGRRVRLRADLLCGGTRPSRTRRSRALLVAMVALSMALAPLLMIFDEKVMQPRFAAQCVRTRGRQDRRQRTRA